MTNRMLRQLHMLSFTEMRPEELEAIFVTITSAFLGVHFDEFRALVRPTERPTRLTCSPRDGTRIINAQCR